MCIGPHVKYHNYACQILIKLEFFLLISEKFSNIKVTGKVSHNRPRWLKGFRVG